MAGFRDDNVLDNIKRDLSKLIDLVCIYEMTRDMNLSLEREAQLHRQIKEHKTNLKTWIDSEEVRPDKYEAITKLHGRMS